MTNVRYVWSMILFMNLVCTKQSNQSCLNINQSVVIFFITLFEVFLFCVWIICRSTLLNYNDLGERKGSKDEKKRLSDHRPIMSLVATHHPLIATLTVAKVKLLCSCHHWGSVSPVGSDSAGKDSDAEPGGGERPLASNLLEPDFLPPGGHHPPPPPLLG